MSFSDKLLALHAIAVIVLSVSVCAFLYALVAICTVLQDREESE